MNVNEKFLKSLEFEQLSYNEKKYIESAVKYLDESMSEKMKNVLEDEYFETYIREIMRIVDSIKSRSTGDSTLDSMVMLLPYTDSFIASIAENGGIYRNIVKSDPSMRKINYLLEEFSKHRNTEKSDSLSKSRNRILQEINLSDEDKEYIVSAKDFIESSIDEAMENEQPRKDFIEEYTKRMIETVRRVKSKSTGVQKIDEGTISPDMADYFISILSKYGGFFDYVTSFYAKEIYSSLEYSEDELEQMSKKPSIMEILSVLNKMNRNRSNSNLTKVAYDHDDR